MGIMTNISIESVYSSARRYPLPFFALIGLVVGSALFLTGQSLFANVAWYAVLLLGGIPIVVRTIRQVLRGRLSADVIAMLAIVVAMLVNESFAGAIIVLMQSGGEALEDYGFNRASSSLEELTARTPKSARRKVGNHIEEIDANAVKVGDILVIRHGDLIPADGKVTSEKAYVDESALTGEPVPRTVEANGKLLSGSINVGDTFEMRTTAISEESQYAKIVKMVRDAQENKPKIQRLADKYATYFTPLTIAIAFIGYLMTHSVITVLAVLVVATPCPLIIAVPIAVIAAVNKAANESIIVKNGAAIEQISDAKAVLFDKTGTITYGSPLVDEIIPFGRHTKKEILYMSASVEQLSSHPLSVSIVTAARKEFERLEKPKGFKEVPSKGVEGVVKGSRVLVGSRGFFEARIDGSTRLYLKIVERSVSEGKLYSFVAIGGKLAGIIVFTDKIRPGVTKMIGRLKGLGVGQITMLTGDNEQNARVIADAAGIKDYRAGLLPAEKVEIVKDAKSKGTTIMVGDGINDAPALATATVGVAMGAHGTGISAEAADIVLLVDDVTKVTDAILTGRRMLKIAKQSIFFGIGLSSVLMVIATTGVIPPPVGAILQEAIDVTVILNALRAR
ncbi:MAG: heavy metal translocating P-type ATPase [Candidatus Micrarchaeota archaeon]|nr:heavy metal translocating P-type ATPase [Candidatus Micrarchaeota archaeon]